MRHLLPHESFRQDPWRSRGYVPHLDEAGLVQHVTFRLADSLPRQTLDRWRQELAALPDSEHRRTLTLRSAAWLDRGLGKCHLRDDRIADLVERTMLHFDGERYRLLAWCIIPNHVHAIVETFDGWPLDRVLHSWKGYSSSKANEILGRSGRLWQAEYFDRFVRDPRHLVRAVDYVEYNPVSAGLVGTAEEWRWGSAWRRTADA